MKTRALGTAAAGVMLSMLCGCVNAGFKLPNSTAYVRSATPDEVMARLRELNNEYATLIRRGENGRLAFEIPIIVAAAVVPTALALGQSQKFAIYGAGIAGGGAALSSYMQPRDRIGYAVQAQAATTCILREYGQQLGVAEEIGLFQSMRDETITDKDGVNKTTRVSVMAPTALLTTAPSLQQEVADAHIMALAAADEVTARLRARLARMGTAPDFGAIVGAIRQKYDQASADSASSQKILTSTDPQKIRRISEYPARIEECVNKIQ